MKTYKLATFNILWMMVFFFGLVFMATANEESPPDIEEVSPVGIEMTITGYVNGNYQIEGDDGNFYEIEEGEAGNELIQRVGEKVSAKGNVIEESEINYISVTSFKVIAE